MELKALVQDELEELFDSRAPRAAFATTRAMNAGDLALSVEGVGPVSFPVSKTAVRKIRSVARPAKYGKGTDTIEDRRVRDTWVVPKSRVRIDGRRWRKTLGPALEAIHGDLGLPEGTRLRAKLHDMLVYEEGQFFLAHQDTEKTEAMVATLVVVLPSSFDGGESVITHGDATIVEAARSRSKLTFLAFYADCRHEVRPVTRGHRVALTYALELLGEPAPAPWTPESQRALTELVEEHFASEVIIGWDGQQAVPDRWVYLLDHQYTPRTLSWRKLKGRDADVAAALRRAADEGDHDVFLATAEVHERWMCEPEDWGYRGWGRPRYGDRRPVDDGGHPPLVELHEETVALDDWIDADGKRTGEAASAVAYGELLWGMDHGGFTPFEVEHEGYMGNYGDTVDRWYHRAAIVLRPRSRAFILRAKHDAAYALETISARLEVGERTEAARLTEELLPYWPYLARRASGASVVRTAAAFGQPELAEAWLAPLSLGAASDPVGLHALSRVYGVDWLRSRVIGWSQDRFGRDRVRSEDQAAWLGALAGLTGEELLAPERAWLQDDLSKSAVWLCDTFAMVDSSRAPSRRGPAQLELVLPSAHLFEAALGLDEPELSADLRRTLADPPESELANRAAVLEGLHERLGDGPFVAAALPGIARQLTGTIEEQLAGGERAPGDWSIAATWDCPRCALCPELHEFLRAPGSRVFEWPLAKARRQHVHQRIDAHELPVTHRTRRQGRPYTLVLQKTERLFDDDRAERARLAEALEVMTALGALGAPKRKRPARKK